MVFALETWKGAEDGSGAARIEEEVVVTKDGCEIITNFPSNRLISCGLPGCEVFLVFPPPHAVRGRGTAR